MTGLVAEVLGERTTPKDFSGALTVCLQLTQEDGTALTLEVCSGQVFHTFLGQLAAGADPMPGFG